MRKSLFWLVAIVLILAGCQGSPIPTATNVPPPTDTMQPAPTSTPLPPTDTPPPTSTSAPPTATPVPPTETAVPTDTPAPPTATPEPPTHTPAPPTSTPAPTLTAIALAVDGPPHTHLVCASGCEFTTIQAAIDDVDESDVAIIEVTDAVHTEAGIIVNKNVVIRGLGAEHTIVQAAEKLSESEDRVFFIPKDASVMLDGMTIRHGRPGGEEERGGGILNYGSLTIRECLITHNSGIGGGGIATSDGEVTLIASTVDSNTARGDGPRGESCGGGGGVLCRTGSLYVLHSTISNNRAGLRLDGLGGGLRAGCGCTAEIVNSTISGNKAKIEGGGIVASGEVTLIHSTITDNMAGTGWGALWVRGKVHVINSIIAGNSYSSGDCAAFEQSGHLPGGEFLTNRGNWIGDGSCDAAFSGDPMLGILEDNGGSTMTHALSAGSPAIDAVPCMVSTDQRGVERGAASGMCDIGAYEWQAE